MRFLGPGLLCAVVALLLAGPAAAQPKEARGAPAGQFDFYVLSLSWSPGFCEAGGRVRGLGQCESGTKLGFVVHGLWPQNESGYPTFCQPGGRFVSRQALQETTGLFPDEGLARQQWRKHGSCTGESPSEYFRAVARARERIQVPPRLESPETGTQVLAHEIELAFASANPGLRPEMMAVECGRRIFQEIRICFEKDLRSFRACPEVDRDGCRAGAISVPPVR